MLEKRAENQKQQDAKRALDQSASAAKAVEIWGLSHARTHPYLERKQIKGNCSRTYNGSLVVPAYKDGRLTSCSSSGRMARSGFSRAVRLQVPMVRWVRIPR